jgi:hypothetical protein
MNFNPWFIISAWLVVLTLRGSMFAWNLIELVLWRHEDPVENMVVGFMRKYVSFAEAVDAAIFLLAVITFALLF